MTKILAFLKSAKWILMALSLVYVALIIIFFYCKFISKDKIYVANLQIIEQKALDSLNFYKAKLKFPSIIFRSQDNISTITLLDSDTLGNLKHPDNLHIITFEAQNAPKILYYKVNFNPKFIPIASAYYIVAIILVFLLWNLNNALICGKIKIDSIFLTLIISLYALGALLRIYYYIDHKDLWLDEAALAASIYSIDFSEIFFRPLPFGQASPLGFLMMTKILCKIFGYSEYVLYFLPLVCGILTLYLSYKIGFLLFPIKKDSIKKDSIKSIIESNKENIISYLSAFSLASLVVGSLGLLYYSSEFKQYGIESFISFLLIFLYLKGVKFKNFMFFSVICILFSNTSVFIILAISLGYAYANKADIKGFLRENLYYFLMFILCFLAYYFLYIKYQASNGLYKYWEKYFLPHNLSEYPSFIKGVLLGVFSGFNVYNSARLVPVYMFVSFIGLFWLYKSKKDMFLVLISALLIYISLSLFHIYPFGHEGVIGGRLSLFMSVIFYISCSFGVYFLLCFSKFSRVIILFLLAILSFDTYKMQLKSIGTPQYIEQTHALIKKIESNAKENDIVYVYNGVKPAFLYYTYLDGVNLKYEEFDSNLDALIARIKGDFITSKFSGTAWILASHYYDNTWEENLIQKVKTLDKNAKITKATGDFGSVVIRLER